ncbi:MAG: Ldh family oxidoreductase [Alphaproteobacteria bacterium]|nr:Ldh family oxidoreductase [Alphaproteobacteria bacterium]
MTERLVSADALKAFVKEVLQASNVAEDHAEVWADMLVWANLRGMDSHGVLRIPRYTEYMKNGNINAKPDITVEQRAGAIATIDADWAPGPVALTAAMDEALGRARECHVGWCIVRNITHGGAIGYYALQAAREGFAGIVITASRPMMAYYGAKVPGASTNPIAIAVPGGDHPPMVLDMSTATASMGKILAARDTGSQIPDGWGLDAEGNPTNDADAVETLMPLGGAKGSGLSMMIECLVSLFAANPLVEPNIRPDAKPFGYRQNGLCAAIDISAFTDLATYRDEIDKLAAGLKGLPRADGVDEIYAPGERGDAVLAERTKSGIPLPAGTWDRLKAEADKLGIAMPPTL